MSVPPLSLVPSSRLDGEDPDLDHLSPLAVISSVSPESPAARAARLMEEARSAADEQVRALEQALLSVAQLSAEIAVGGDAYPPGVREICRKLVDDAIWRTQALHNITGHTRSRRR